jgi:hypothetical protein
VGIPAGSHTSASTQTTHSRVDPRELPWAGAAAAGPRHRANRLLLELEWRRRSEPLNPADA